MVGACEYFAWVEDNPLYEAKAFSFQADVTTPNLPKMRAVTISGLCILLDIRLTSGARVASRSSDHLVVDDDPNARELLRRHLQRGDYAVRMAANGQEAMQLARKLHPDVVRLDVMMPQMDGWACSAR